jgi:hypothetical protein
MALVRKKTEKKPATGMTSKTAGKKVSEFPQPGTALAKVGPEIVVDPKDNFTKTEMREAERLDEKVQKTIARMGKDLIAVGEMFEEIQSKGFHRALGFNRMEDYIRSRGGELGKSQVFQAMSIVRNLTSGPNPTVSKEDVREMPKDNAEALVRMKKAGVTITPEIIQDAKTLPVHRFQAEIEDMSPNLGQRNAVERGEHLDASPEILVPRKFMLSGSVAARLAKAVIVADRLTKGNDPQQSFDDRVIEFIVADFLSEYEAEYEQAMGNDIAEGEHNATVYRDSLGPEAPAVVEDGFGVDIAEDEEEDADVVHQPEAEGTEAEETAVEKPFNAPAVCKGKTAAGTPCNSMAVKGTEFCFAHRNQAAA